MNPSDRQSDADRALVQEIILGILGLWEPYHKKWMRRANHFYGLYRNYQDFKNAYNSTTTERGRDRVYGDAEGEFGEELFIPMCFSTVETILPAMLSMNPEMTVLPRDIASEPNVDSVKAMIESQQEKIKYPLRLQTIAKDGLITGLGVEKTRWRTDFRVKQQLQPDPESGFLSPQHVLEQLFDDPDAEAVDPFDFIADPFCSGIEDAEGAFHRTWRSTRYVKNMALTGQWRNLESYTAEEVMGLAQSQKYNEVWNERRMIGDRQTTTGSSSMGKADIHEVLEFHDGDRVVTILDRTIVVAQGENPNWHRELPFQVFRPTELAHELHGIGEIEPIEQLQEELNTLRTQRRYNADLVLQKVFAYHDGQVEREDIQFGPGYAIPVNGNPQEVLFPLQIGDIPNSGYQEEDRIGADIDRTSGVSDVIAGAGLAGSDTATGVQLVQNAASRRIEAKTRRLELEIVGPCAEQWLKLNQQRILSNRDVRVPALPSPHEPDRRWAWMQVGPYQLAGEFEIRAVPNSMQPENIPQDRADAQMLMTLFAQVPGIEAQKLAELALRKMGVKQPREYLAPPAPMIPAETLNRLADAGVPDRLLAEALAQAGGPNLLGGAQQAPTNGQENIAGPGPEPPGEGGPPVRQPAELPESTGGEGGEGPSQKEPEPAAGG